MNIREPRFHPAWRLPANPAFIPLGEPSIDAAWRVPNVNLAQKSPSFFMGGGVGVGVEQNHAATKPSIYAAWRAQHLRRLASPAFTPLGEPSIDAAWRVPNVNLAQKGPSFFMGGGVGAGVKQNHAATKPSIYAAW